MPVSHHEQLVGGDRFVDTLDLNHLRFTENRSATNQPRCRVTEQNFDFGGSSMPHDPYDSPAAVSAGRPSSTPVSCHRWSTLSVRLARNPNV
jgi:hypothetical protein